MIGLAAAHAPSEYSTGMFDAKAFGDLFILGAHIVMACHFREWFSGGAGWRCGLAVTEKRGDDDEIIFW